MYPYFQHDNRGNNQRTMGRNRKFNSRGSRAGPWGPRQERFVHPDGDMEMAPDTSWNNTGRYNPYKPQKNSSKRRRPKNKAFKKQPQDKQDEGNWFKVHIPHGQKLGKNFILKSLMSLTKSPFVPFNFQFDGLSALFFVNDRNIASDIKGISRRITTPEGHKMAVFVTESSAPVSTMDDEVAEKIKTCMSNRYDVATHALNLSQFHHDADLRSSGYYVPLYKPSIVNLVVKIIKEHIPELEILDLSENRLNNLEAFSALVPVCKQLTTLNLQNNRLKHVNELNHIKGMNIISLVLDGNRLCDDYDKNSYISAIRERLPKLMKLDGQELAAPIGFDLGSQNLPSSKGSFFIAEDVKVLVLQFLEQYYIIYDSQDRGRLLDAYHEQASFSLNVVKGPSHSSNQASLRPYYTESRNLLRVADSAFRFKLLKQGRLAVVSALTQLPPTQHDPHSFVIDIFHVSPGLMTFCVMGVFKEVGDDDNQPLLAFHRTFLAVPQNEGFVIANEVLCITNATSEQVKCYKFPAPTPSPSPAPSMGDKSPSEKQQLVIELMKVTGMNADFSSKCLEENEWDYQKACFVFGELNNVGKIPKEAFIVQ